MNIILIDFRDNWLNLLPFTFTRPVGKIRAGIFTIEEKWFQYMNTGCSFITEDYLSLKYPVKSEKENLIINSIILPDAALVREIKNLSLNEILSGDGIFIAARVTEKDIDKIMKQETASFRNILYASEFNYIKWSWDIFIQNSSEIRKDFELLKSKARPFRLSKTNVVIGNPEHLIIEEGVSAECVVFNVTDGPIYIGRETVLMEGAMLKGPVAICEHSMVKMGAKIYQGTTIGPHCRAGGEINNCVIFGYSNKSHDGFLGHAVIGEWCNLGADTNNSNLKNNYEEVKVWNYKEKSFIKTGLTFCGLFMGDHSKCSINTMFNTGTTVGVAANIFGAGFPRTFIPSFSWGGASGFIDYDISKALETARIMMSRRDLALEKTDIDILTTIFDRTAEFRK